MATLRKLLCFFLTLVILGAGGYAQRETLRRAQQGDALAQADLGIIYANGLGVPKDYQEALKWFRKAADQVLPTVSGYNPRIRGLLWPRRGGKRLHQRRDIGRFRPFLTTRSEDLGSKVDMGGMSVYWIALKWRHW